MIQFGKMSSRVRKLDNFTFTKNAFFLIGINIEHRKNKLFANLLQIVLAIIFHTCSLYYLTIKIMECVTTKTNVMDVSYILLLLLQIVLWGLVFQRTKKLGWLLDVLKEQTLLGPLFNKTKLLKNFIMIAFPVACSVAVSAIEYNTSEIVSDKHLSFWLYYKLNTSQFHIISSILAAIHLLYLTAIIIAFTDYYCNVCFTLTKTIRDFKDQIRRNLPSVSFNDYVNTYTLMLQRYQDVEQIVSTPAFFFMFSNWVVMFMCMATFFGIETYSPSKAVWLTRIAVAFTHFTVFFIVSFMAAEVNNEGKKLMEVLARLAMKKGDSSLTPQLTDLAVHLIKLEKPCDIILTAWRLLSLSRSLILPVCGNLLIFSILFLELAE